MAPPPDLAARFVRPVVDPGFDRERMSVALYRLLAQGQPVAEDRLVEAAGVPPERVAEALAQWPNIFRDADGRVTAFGGLALEPTAHKFEIRGRVLHTWCAWDTLFLPLVLDGTAHVASRSPLSGEPIRLTVGPDGVSHASPAGTMLSLVQPGDFGRNLIKDFCANVHFLASRDEGAKWASEHDGAFIVSLADGFELGRAWVEHNYGRALTENASAG